jgi:surface polysaccharide O-acyltransferase-like enzyme
MGKTERNSAFELLRIFSMLLIVLFHVSRNFDGDLVIDFLGSWSIVGVDCFVVMNGFFLGGSLKGEYKNKIMYLIGNVLFYEFVFIIVRLAYSLLMKENLCAVMYEYFLSGILDPVWCQTYWFITAYIILLLFAPLLNEINIERLNTLCRIMIFVTFIANFQGGNFSTVCDCAMFISMYLLGWQLRLNAEKWRGKIYIAYPIVIISFVISRILIIKNIVSSDIVGLTIGNYGRYSVMMLLIALGIVLIVSYIKPFYNRKVNYIASLMLGVYMFHENPTFNLSFNLYKISRYYVFNDYINYFLLVVGIFFGGIIFEGITAHVRRLLKKKS